MVELAGVQRLIGGALANPDMQPVRPPHQPVQMHPLGGNAKDRQRPTVDRRQYRPGRRRPHIERLVPHPAKAQPRRRAPQRGQGGWVVQHHRARLLVRPGQRQQSGGKLRRQPAHRRGAHPKRHPPARQHRIITGQDMSQQCFHASALARNGRPANQAV